MFPWKQKEKARAPQARAKEAGEGRVRGNAIPLLNDSSFLAVLLGPGVGVAGGLGNGQSPEDGRFPGP